MRKALLFAGVFLLACAFSTAAFAQKATGEIHGTVFDPSSTVVPKAQVTATDTATGLTKSTLSGADGSYLIPNLLDGNYTVAATAPGFQKSVYTGVVVDAGRTTDLPLTLKIGTVNDTVEVAAASTPLETTSNQVATTVRNDAIIDLPLAARDTLTFASLSAGYANGTFDGLFQAALNISLDGTNVNDNRNKSGSGFASLVPLRLDAVDEVTVTTSGLEADAGAGGAMTIQFTTKRGTSQYHGSLFEQFQNDDLNANTFFNNMRRLPIAKVRANDFGGDLGGPLNLPFSALKHKLFFFVNLEAAPRPGSANDSTTLLTSEAQSGVFRYAGTDGQQHTINMLTLAGANGYKSTIDPTVASVLSVIDGTIGKGTVLPSASNFFQQSLNWKIATGSLDLYPTARLDYQITDKVAWHIAWNLQHEHVNPTGSTYPGLPGQAGESKFTHYALSNGVDWSIKPNLYNSLKIGIQSSVNGTNIGNSVHQWASQGDKIINFGSGISPFIPNAVPEITDDPAYTISDDLNWVKGRHTLKFGGSGIYTRFYDSQYYQDSGILSYNLGIAANDPINSVFTAANIPFINSSDVSTASQLYATLTGRVSSIGGYNNIDETTRQFQKYAPLTYRENYASWGLYFQDSFRLSPRLTLNYGLRWQFTGVMTNTNNTFMSPTLMDVLAPSYADFQPGVLLPNNYVPSIAQRSVTYAPDHINPSPNFGFAWNPDGGDGFIGKLLGHGQTVIRSSYSINYFDEGLNDYYWINTNAGNWQQISATAGAQFAPGSQTLQSPDPSFLVAPPAFTPPFPEGQFAFQGYNVGTTKGQANGSGLPEMKNPYVQSWNLGIQREIGKSNVLEVRYVGNKTTHKWHLYGVQEVNIFENGFLNEFQNAQKNLAINAASGVNSFQNRGLPGQVALPIFQTAFSANGTQPALSASQGFTSNTFINDLNLGLAGSAASMGYAVGVVYPYCINFFVPNPYVADLTVTDDNSYATYNALQVTLRHRLRGGLTVTGNYTFSKGLSDMYGGSNTLTEYYATIRNFGLNKGPIPQDVRQVFQSYFTYDLPVGKGRPLNISNGILNRMFGGWSIAGIWTLTSGHVAKLTSGEHTVNVNSGTDSGVVLQGLSLSQLSGELATFSNGPNGTTLYSAARSLIGPTGRANIQYLALPETPGQFGQFLFVYGPQFFSADMSLNKEIPIKDRARFSIQGEFLNFMNHPVFSAGSYNINSTSFGQTSSTAVGPRVIQLRANLRW